MKWMESVDSEPAWRTDPAASCFLVLEWTDWIKKLPSEKTRLLGEKNIVLYNSPLYHDTGYTEETLSVLNLDNKVVMQGEYCFYFTHFSY